ncbi:MAG: large conductance mechanosensitive channel protein MscL, partial [Coriobacteriaceae bacterium]|nr:large conductance mechanosensitive channel protein MscL [Coriobacteriaceae bacterium]
MAKITEEFKEFISRGNMMDMAVGIIIGGAFTAIVNSLVESIIQPLIEFVSGGSTEVSGLVVPGTNIDFGAFISACINFLIIAIVVFCLIKALNNLKRAGEKIVGKEKVEEEEAAPRTCPFCFEEIH